MNTSKLFHTVVVLDMALAASPLTRVALQTVLADEIDRARPGWAHITTPFVTRKTIVATALEDVVLHGFARVGIDPAKAP
jgi:hypothetical protein